MKVVVTGTHFTPAQAVIEELRQNPKIELVYFGRLHTLEGDKALSVESQILPKLGVKFIALTSGRLQRRFTRYTIPSLLKIPIGLIQSFYLLLKEQPDVVLSFGGYLSVPVVIAAWCLSIPVITHEQTLVMALANQINAIFAQKILVSFDQKYDFPASKTVLTGNPLRKELFTEKKLDSKVSRLIDFAHRRHLPIIYVTGGNQGSHLINQAIGEILADLTARAVVIHQTGESKFNDFENLTIQAEGLAQSARYLPLKWIDVWDLRVLLKSADLVVSRAGANTLTELALFGVPTLLIPLPFLNRNEQMVNARYFSQAGLAQILPQSQLTGPKLKEEMEKMLKMRQALKKQAAGVKKLIVLDGAKKIAQQVYLTLSQNV